MTTTEQTSATDTLADGYYCNLFVCLPSSPNITLPLDGITQIPVTVTYAIWKVAGGKTIEVDDASGVTMALITYENTTWGTQTYDAGTSIPTDDATSAAGGWYSNSTKGADAIVAGKGCAGIPPTNDQHIYYSKTFYLSHDYADAQDIADNNNPTAFGVAATLTYAPGGVTWDTSKDTAKNVKRPQNTQNQYQSIKIEDGTPQIDFYMPPNASGNAIIGNGTTCIPITLYFQISSIGRSTPLSTQGTASRRLLEFTSGKPLDGYAPDGATESWGNWQSSTTAALPPMIENTGLPDTCNKCGLKQPTPRAIATTFYISHTFSYMRQAVSIAIYVTYTPPKNPNNKQVVWNTSLDPTWGGTPYDCCLTITSLSPTFETEVKM